MNLRNIDLNLLTIFDAIMAERNMTRAATRLGMSQPAISNALTRLRAVTGDPLFTRTARGMVPTTRAEALAGHVRQALDLMRAGLSESAVFTPSQSERSFTLALGDYNEVVYLPPLLNTLKSEGPNISYSFVTPAGTTLTRELKEGQVDLVWDSTPIDSNGFHSDIVIEDDVAWAMSETHPLADMDHPTIDDYMACEHLRLDAGFTYVHDVDQQIRSLGLKRNFTVAFGRSIPMTFTMADVNCVATLPRRMLDRFAAILPIVVKPLPFTLSPTYMYQSWHEAADADPGHAWLRQRIMDLTACYRRTS